MKNVILTHKELQLNLFLAFSYGLMQQQPSQDLHIVADLKEEGHFEWGVYRHHQLMGCADDGELVFNKCINKGAYQMNDVRLGVTIDYLRDQANEFLKDLKEYLQSEARNVKQPILDVPASYSLQACFDALKKGRNEEDQRYLDILIKKLNKSDQQHI